MNDIQTTTATTTTIAAIESVNPFPDIEGFGDFHFPSVDDVDSFAPQPDVDNSTEDWHHVIDRMPEESDLFNTTFDDLMPLSEDEGCHCRPPPEVFCRCFGQSVTEMPSNLTQNLTRL